MTISEALYKDVRSTVLESGALRVQVLPDFGGKITSLYDKARTYEYLVQAPGKTYRRQPYDGVYVSGECSGFDDMFPTIDPCHYEEYPWTGTRLPDHGEVWSLPWEQAVHEGRIDLSVHGVRLPYLLEKTLSMPEEDVLHIDYALTNTSPFPLHFLWAAHIMITIVEGTQVVLPQQVVRAAAVFSRSGRVGGYSSGFDWPRPAGGTGAGSRLDVSRSAEAEDMEKYYLEGPLPEGRCELRFPDGRRFLLQFPVETVPYLGILMNENGWTNQGVWDRLCNIFLEPCTATFDRIDVARLRQECSTLPANGIRRWFVRIQV